MTDRIRGRQGVARRAAFLRMHPLCVACERAGRITEATEVDHIIRLVDGGSDEDTNKQALCGPCHKDKTAREQGNRSTGADESGIPTDPSHHWNME